MTPPGDAAREADGTVTIHADGREARVRAGISVAAALLDLGLRAFRRSVQGEPRGPVCGMGTCFECRVTIDDVPHRRACLASVTDGMRIVTGSFAASEGAASPAPLGSSTAPPGMGRE